MVCTPTVEKLLPNLRFSMGHLFSHAIIETLTQLRVEYIRRADFPKRNS